MFQLSSIDYIFLFLLLYFVFFMFTRIRQKTINERFWVVVAIPIIIYTLVLGCRYGWGNDFMAYKHRFEYPFFYKEESPGFRSINVLLADVGFNYTGAFCFYSFTFICGVYSLLKCFKENKYMLFIFLPATVLYSTATIRESFAVSFVYFGISYLIRRRWIPAMVMLLIMTTIHSAPIIPLGLLLVVYIFFNKLLPLKISLSVYWFIFIFSPVFGSFLLEIISGYLPFIDLGDKYQSYIDNSEYWLSEEGYNSIYKQSPLTSFLLFIFHSSIIYLGYLGLKYHPNKYVNTYYILVFIGMCIQKSFFELEILRRIGEAMIQMYFIPVGYSFYYLVGKYFKILSREERKMAILAKCTFIVYLILFYSRFIFLSPEKKFFWDIIG